MADEKASNIPKMEYRFLGRSGLQVSAISLGGWLTYGGHVENGMLPVNFFARIFLQSEQMLMVLLHRKNICMHEGGL